jgi:hypothetical protein
LERGRDRGETCGTALLHCSMRHIERLKKKNQNHVESVDGHRRITRHNNQPKACRRDGGGEGWEPQGEGGAGEARIDRLWAIKLGTIIK